MVYNFYYAVLYSCCPHTAPLVRGSKRGRVVVNARSYRLLSVPAVLCGVDKAVKQQGCDGVGKIRLHLIWK